MEFLDSPHGICRGNYEAGLGRNGADSQCVRDFSGCIDEGTWFRL
jgi:hypothetical protein